MKNPTQTHLGVVASLLLFTTAVTLSVPVTYAHHCMARYDTGQVITVNGVVTKYVWANPHVYIHIDQVTEAGNRIAWEIEVFPPAIMRRQGWSKDTLRTGDAISVSGNPAKNLNNKSLYPTVIKRADRTLFRKPGRAEAPGERWRRIQNYA